MIATPQLALQSAAAVARDAGVLFVSGRLERSEGVVNVVAERIEALALAASSVRSRDFH